MRPHWDRGLRRLNLPAIIDDSGNITQKADHVSPAAWIGDVHVSTVVPYSCWVGGYLKAIKIIPNGKEILERTSRTLPTFDILSHGPSP